MKCTHCHRERNEESFRTGHNDQAGDKVYKTCNVCRSSARLRVRPSTPKRKAYYKEYKRKHYVNKLAYSYSKTKLCTEFGYSPEDLADYNIKHTTLQSSCCPICGKRAKFLVLDHNHITGQLRGMVCRSCNLGIGNLKDSADICIKAAGYINKYNN